MNVKTREPHTTWTHTNKVLDDACPEGWAEVWSLADTESYTKRYELIRVLTDKRGPIDPKQGSWLRGQVWRRDGWADLIVVSGKDYEPEAVAYVVMDLLT